MPDLISIVMPVKDVEPFIEECLQSILEQTYDNWELIVVNDHSKDQTVQIIDRFSQKDRRIRFLNNKGEGIVPALKMAIQSSNGKYISRMDGDDLMPRNKLEVLLSKAGPKKVVTGKVKYFASEEVSRGYRRYEKWLNGIEETNDFWKFIYRECVIASPNWLIEKKFFDSFDWNRWKYPEDYDLVFHWMENGYKTEVADEVTHLWREHPNRTSRNSDIYQQASFFSLKTQWFVKNEADNKPLQVIGNGNKSKLVKKSLDKLNVPYEQYDLYSNEVIQPLDKLNANRKTILTNWPIEKHLQEEIQNYLENKGFKFGENLWLF